MKTLFMLLLAGIFSPTVLASSIIILDEGINTQQRLDVPNNLRGPQGCVSSRTDFFVGNNGNSNDQASFLSGSLCTDDTQSRVFGDNVAQHQNRRTYTLTSENAGLNPTAPPPVNFDVNILLRRQINGIERGEHGNWVSNAAHDYDSTLQHRIWQVFGYGRFANGDQWITETDVDTDTVFPGETVVSALDEIGVFSDPLFFTESLQNGLGAVVMSLGANAGGVSDIRCGANDGQGSVDLLRDLGIAVVVALPNVDIPSNRQSWPACLDGVIRVAGIGANSSTGTRQAGVGANGGIDFFARDTTNDSQEGNSFAAPRVAAAYAKLRGLFPNSTVDQQTEALNQASTLMDTYRTRDVNNRLTTFRSRSLRKNQMLAAIAYLENIFNEPVDTGVNDTLIAVNQVGPVFGDQRRDFSVTFDFDQFTNIAGSSITNFQSVSNSRDGSLVAQQGISNELSASKDLEITFTALFNSGFSSSNGFDLEVNGRRLQRFAGVFVNSPKTFTFVINRNDLSQAGDNTISLTPLNDRDNWGLDNISISYLPIVPLNLGQIDRRLFGYEQNPTRFTGLRMSFNLSTSELRDQYELTVQGFDIDLPDESSVFINGIFLGNLSVAASGQFSPADTFSLPSNSLRQGANFVEFVQRKREGGVFSGFNQERWSVRNIGIINASQRERERQEGSRRAARVVPTLMLLLDDVSESE